MFGAISGSKKERSSSVLFGPSSIPLEKIDLEKIDSPRKEYLKNVNSPDPDNYEILKKLEIDSFVILLIRYLNCTNFEGKKILVFKDVTMEKLEKQKSIDPHFSDSVDFYHPMARFIPNKMGWDMAVQLCQNWSM